jgi:hypothetical protein
MKRSETRAWTWNSAICSRALAAPTRTQTHDRRGGPKRAAVSPGIRGSKLRP